MLCLFVFLSGPSLAAAENCKAAIALYNKGTSSASPGEKESCFIKAIRLCSDPDVLSKAYNNLADTYEQQGRLFPALTYYRKALEVKPDLAVSYFSAADIFFKLQDYHSAYVCTARA